MENNSNLKTKLLEGSIASAIGLGTGYALYEPGIGLVGKVFGDARKQKLTPLSPEQASQIRARAKDTKTIIATAIKDLDTGEIRGGAFYAHNPPGDYALLIERGDKNLSRLGRPNERQYKNIISLGGRDIKEIPFGVSHEVGHSLQHQKHPRLANILGSRPIYSARGIPVIAAGLTSGILTAKLSDKNKKYAPIAGIGAGMLGSLPAIAFEYDASRRGINLLKDIGYSDIAAAKRRATTALGSHIAHRLLLSGAAAIAPFAAYKVYRGIKNRLNNKQ